MEKRHSSSSDRISSPRRPKTHRKRSNSVPIVEALGCSTPEAELILAEGRAAVRSRRASVRRRGRRMKDAIETFRPKDHIQYLYAESAVSEYVCEEPISTENAKSSRHSRIPSNDTDRSTSTIVAPIQTSVSDSHISTAVAARAVSPLGDYSANLAKFIQTQLKSIPTYQPNHSSISPSSCPDLTFQAKSPTKSIRRPAEAPHVIEIPPVRPPLKSAFSAWSSTDDDTDGESSRLPAADLPRTALKTNNSTPSVLGYYESSNGSSFLYSSTPLEEEEEPDTAKGYSFPDQTSLPAPSFSSASTGSYFDYKRPISFAPHIKDRIIAAVTPPHAPGKIIPAISPFEGGALANVHDVLVESQQRVHVDGMTFDMIRDFTMPGGSMRRVQTPC
ncbi:hypothetical protein BU26DRAFT_41490 [Trematosphaeria pertusa]|uniref:Uncharacterized protein n=1 Tax=Trematosphaeria pertusa TaxID=390896 RepID=A0A6A6J514_9PLEO|nr:uncharacterized protein BU26DRAFT_41490 [Trematosphaeria pertusa]KAF2257322.1 hypothetical protein BU26DRAFT_41490 [Trematosphaeria pertusa]